MVDLEAGISALVDVDKHGRMIGRLMGLCEVPKHSSPPVHVTAAEIIRRAMARMPGALAAAGLSARMLLQVHDELVFEAPEAEAGAAMAVIKRVMEGAAEPAVALSVPLVVEAKAAGNWDEAH